MATVQGVDVGDTRTIPRVQINTTREATLSLNPGVSALVVGIDPAANVQQSARIRVEIDWSADGETFRPLVAMQVAPARVDRFGNPPSIKADLPAGTTHVKGRLVPVVGTPTVALYVAAI